MSIKLVIMDVDGVLTDGTISVRPDGEEVKHFNAHDGAGIRYLLRAGIVPAILSGRTASAVEHRARDLGIERVHLGIHDKLPVYEQMLLELALEHREVCYIGDDLMDLPVMRRVGLPVAVANARPEVKRRARYVTCAHGGRGAVREVAEWILKRDGKWKQIVARYGLTT